MTYYVTLDNTVQPNLGQLEQPFGVTVANAFDEGFSGNVTQLAYEYGNVQALSGGNPLPKENAQKLIDEAGIKLDYPESGYNQYQLKYLIERKQKQAARQQIDEATPYDLLGTPVRAGAQLLAGISDPLNVATSFMPVFGAAKVAGMLEAAGASALRRAGVRASIGVGEGAVGAAVLEPFNALLRTDLGDDYKMYDSLQNIAFGGLMGGGLHVALGGIKDVIRPFKKAEKLESPIEQEARAVVSETPTTPKQVINYVEHIPEKPINIDEVARSIDPQIIDKYTALRDEKVSIRAAIDEAINQKPSTSTLPDVQELESQISNIETRLQDVKGKKAKKLQQELDSLKVTRDQVVNEMQARQDVPAYPDYLRQKLLDVDYKMRDMAQAVTQVYNQAKIKAEAQQPAFNKLQALEPRQRAIMQESAFNEAMQHGSVTIPDIMLKNPDAPLSEIKKMAEAERIRKNQSDGLPAIEPEKKPEVALSEAEQLLNDSVEQLKKSGATEEQLDALREEIKAHEEVIKNSEELAKALENYGVCILGVG